MNALLNTWRASLLTRMRKKNKNNYDNRRFRKAMIVHLDKEQTRLQNRKLLANDVYVLFRDHLEQLRKDGRTELSPTEVFLSAMNFASLLMSLPNIKEGIDDELDDLEEDAEGENDAMIISMMATAIMCAVKNRYPNFDYKFAIIHIYIRWDDHPLCKSILIAAKRKEFTWLKKGKKIDLRTCKLIDFGNPTKMQCMNNQDKESLNLRLFLLDDLFASLYEALCKLEAKYQTSSPEKMWEMVLWAECKLSRSKRPDLLVRQMFVDLEPNEALIVESMLLRKLCSYRGDFCRPTLLMKLGGMLLAHGYKWRIVYAKFRESERQYEQKKYKDCLTDYSNKAIPTKPRKQEPQQDKIECLEERELLADLIRSLEHDIFVTKEIKKDYIANQRDVSVLDKDLVKFTRQKKLLETRLESYDKRRAH